MTALQYASDAKNYNIAEALREASVV